MPDVADKGLRQIVGRSLITVSTFAREIREMIADFFRGFSPISQWLFPLREKIAGPMEVVRDHIHYTKIISWVSGYDWAASKTPDWVFDPFPQMQGISGISGIDWPAGKIPDWPFDPQPPIVRPPQIILPGRPPVEPPRIPTPFAEGPEELRFPRIEEAVNRLVERNVMTRETFDAASAQMQQDAFTVAGQLETDTIETIRDTLADDIREGTSLDGFSKRLSERLETSPMSDGHLETVYRTNVQAAFRDGRETLVRDPIVMAVFPYQEYVHIGDDRVRTTHAMLSDLGLNGTNVYRLDDPFWDMFTPPWDYNCRCAVNMLTLEAAAARGVAEAKEWLRTGEPPGQPEYRFQAIPFRPRAGFGTRGRVAV